MESVLLGLRRLEEVDWERRVPLVRPERSVAETTAFLRRAEKSAFLALWRVGDRFANSLAIKDKPLANLSMSFLAFLLPLNTIFLCSLHDEIKALDKQERAFQNIYLGEGVIVWHLARFYSFYCD